MSDNEPDFDTVEDMLKSQHELCMAHDRWLTKEIEKKRHNNNCGGHHV